MAYEPLENLLPRCDGSIYKLVRIAAMRASELANGQPQLIENNSSHKLTTVALREIIAGKVMIKSPGKAGSSKGKKDNPSSNN